MRDRTQLFTTTRQNSLGMIFNITDNYPNGTIIKWNEKSIVVNIPIQRIMVAWFNWSHIGYSCNEAFYMLSAREREFILTGVTDNEGEKND